MTEKFINSLRSIKTKVRTKSNLYLINDVVDLVQIKTLIDRNLNLRIKNFKNALFQQYHQ